MWDYLSHNARVRVSLFVTCLVDQLRPQVGWSSVELLRRAGCEVDFDPRQTCCGQPALNSGHQNQAKAVARGLVGTFSKPEKPVDAIVTPSGSCCSMTQRYPELFADDSKMAKPARGVAAKTYELAAFLVDKLQVADIGAELSGRVSWHDSCHGLRELHLKAAPRVLLANVKGLELVEASLSEECCGFGGTFAVKNPELSVAMADKKIDELEQLGIDWVTGADLSCLMQLGGRLERRGSKIRAVHFAELIAGGLPGASSGAKPGTTTHAKSEFSV